MIANRCRWLPHFFVLLFAGGLLHAEEPLDLSVGSEVDDSVGHDWSLPTGEIVHLRIIDNQFHLFFLDQERAIIEPIYATVILRGEETRNKTNKINLPLRQGSGPFLTHARRQYPAYDYWLRLIITSDETGEDEALVLPRARFQQ